MTKKDYELIGYSIHRTRVVSEMDKNSIRKQAKQAAIHLLITDLATTLQHNDPKFDQDKFLATCGY